MDKLIETINERRCRVTLTRDEVEKRLINLALKDLDIVAGPNVKAQVAWPAQPFGASLTVGVTVTVVEDLRPQVTP